MCGMVLPRCLTNAQVCQLVLNRVKRLQRPQDLSPTTMNVCTPGGWLTLLGMLARVKPGGLHLMAPQCSSWAPSLSCVHTPISETRQKHSRLEVNSGTSIHCPSHVHTHDDFSPVLTYQMGERRCNLCPAQTQVWVNRGTSRRSQLCPDGDLSRAYVRAANFTNTLVAQLMLTTSALGLNYMLEQPADR